MQSMLLKEDNALLAVKEKISSLISQWTIGSMAQASHNKGGQPGVDPQLALAEATLPC